MKIRLLQLILAFKKAREVIEFHGVSCFFGQMGSGKSTIARLVDFCLGGTLEDTPALQSEFVSATLRLTVEGKEALLTRERGSNQIRAAWSQGESSFEVAVPARRAEGIVLPDTHVEVVSDLVFYLAGTQPPMVRRSRQRDESELARLSLRNLWWYCYLEQADVDSTFFHLDPEAEQQRRLRSREVLRYLVGYHQERVIELENELEDTRDKREKAEQGAAGLRSTLVDFDATSAEEIAGRREVLVAEIKKIEAKIQEVRDAAKPAEGHAVDSLRAQGRQLAAQLAEVEATIADLAEQLSEEDKHLYEIRLLSVKAKRAVAATGLLSGVAFESCPQCLRQLPAREAGACAVCGQPPSTDKPTTLPVELAEKDTNARASELADSVAKHRAAERRAHRRAGDLRQRKAAIDDELSAALRDYDSKNLAAIVMLQEQRSRLQLEAQQLDTLSQFVSRAEKLEKDSDRLKGKETEIRRELARLREAAERDAKNLRRLEALFLDCLLRARVPGISARDAVAVDANSFFPTVTSTDTATITSFSTLGSGGKKTLFKCCFAIAVHRLATEIGARLPTVLIIDTAMKNISERENREQFENFHKMLYEFAASELKQTQLILIDKEYCPPAAPLATQLDLYVREMKLGDPKHPPLIGYYTGH
jgi:hypothetical protein